MGMAPCPECGEQISTSAKNCPKCGKSLKGKSGCGKVILIFLGLALLGGMVSSITSSSSSSRTTTSNTGTSSSSSSSSTEAPLSEEEQIAHILRNTDIHSITVGRDLLSIHFNVSDNLTNDMVRDGAKSDVRWILKNLDDEGISFATVDITGRLSMVDRYGNSEIQDVIELRYRKADLDRINWDNFLWTNMYGVAEYVWLHPAFQ